MSDEGQGQGTGTGPQAVNAAAGEAPGGERSRVRWVMDFVHAHPKTSLVLGAGVSAVVGMELLAAALVGGAVALVFGQGRAPRP